MAAQQWAILPALASVLTLSAHALPAPPGVTVTLAAHGQATSTIVIAPDAPTGVQQAAAGTYLVDSNFEVCDSEDLRRRLHV